ncbi:MAG: HAD-IA family hydrolase [Agrobacterium sp.]|nr:HAD-IA family hydrolase [Agrobacterium sp.]
MPILMMDVDGVLVSGRPRDGTHLFTDLEKDLGISLDSLQQEFFIPRWTAIVTGERELEPELADVLKQIAPHVDVETLISYWFENDSRISPEVLDAISIMRGNGAKVFLATNQEHRRASYLMNEMGLSAGVDGIFYSAALGCRKPSSEFYRKATDLADTSASEIFFVDDSSDNVEAARTFGWNALHWTNSSTADDLLRWWRGNSTGLDKTRSS